MDDLVNINCLMSIKPDCRVPCRTNY